MLNRHQYLDLQIKTRRSANCFFSQLPPEIIREISTFGRDDTEFNEALKHAAYGRLDDVKKMLEKNPALVLLAGNVTTPGGLQVKNTTLLECALLSGDPEMAERILPYFGRLTNADGSKQAGAEEEKQRQLSRCKAHIEALAEQIKSKRPAFDLRPLIATIQNSPAADITEALTINDPNRTETRNTPLRKELAKFRRAVKPKIKTDGMHYEHYSTLIHALRIFDREWDNLYRTSGNNYDKCDLVWGQVIGYLQRSLPPVDRFVFARGLFDLVELKMPLERTLDYKYGKGSYPDTPPTDSSLAGLGFDYGIYSARRRAEGFANCYRATSTLYISKQATPSAGYYKTYVERKQRNLVNLCSDTQKPKTGFRV